MRKSLNYFAVLFIFLLVAVAVSAQTFTPKPRKYKTISKVQLFADSDIHSKKIADIPADVILESSGEGGNLNDYLYVKYKDKSGWILKAEVKRHMDVPAPEIVCANLGYKITGNIYRHYFNLRNEGILPYTGKITLRLFSEEGKQIYEETTDFSNAPLAAESGGKFMIDLQSNASRFELEHKDGTIKAEVGKLIERSP